MFQGRMPRSRAPPAVLWNRQEPASGRAGWSVLRLELHSLVSGCQNARRLSRILNRSRRLRRVQTNPRPRHQKRALWKDSARRAADVRRPEQHQRPLGRFCQSPPRRKARLPRSARWQASPPPERPRMSRSPLQRGLGRQFAQRILHTAPTRRSACRSSVRRLLRI